MILHSFAKSCEGDDASIDAFVLTTSDVTAISVAGGTPIPTHANSTLPDGLRAAVVEILRRKGKPWPCPRAMPLAANGRPMIHRRAKPGRPLAVTLAGTQHWRESAHPPAGACQLAATQLPRETVAYEGNVATRIRPHPGLVGRALLSCADTVYIYQEEHRLTSAVLLNASHPGATPPPLAGMKRLAGYPGIFEAPGGEGERVARRIPGAWLVVEEEDGVGLGVPVELLDDCELR